jgi:hypothetical protein
MGEDILSVIFLVLICIVIAGIAYRASPGQMMVPTFALIAVCLWVSLDFILTKRHKKCNHEEKHDVEYNDIDDKIQTLSSELNFVDEKDVNLTETVKKPEDELKPEATHKNEFDIDLYDKEYSIQELHKEMGSSGDTRLANRMKYMGLQERMAKDIRAKWNVEKLRPYFEEELQENEHRDWWDNEVEYLDDLM